MRNIITDIIICLLPIQFLRLQNQLIHNHYLLRQYIATQRMVYIWTMLSAYTYTNQPLDIEWTQGSIAQATRHPIHRGRGLTGVETQRLLQAKYRGHYQILYITMVVVEHRGATPPSDTTLWRTHREHRITRHIFKTEDVSFLLGTQGPIEKNNKKNKNKKHFISAEY